MEGPSGGLQAAGPGPPTSLGGAVRTEDPDLTALMVLGPCGSRYQVPNYLGTYLLTHLRTVQTR